MPEAPVKVPDNFDELQERLRTGWVKGRAAGATNTALANTSKMLAQLFLEKEKNKITPYQQAQLDMQREQLDMVKAKDEQANWTLEDVNGDGVKEWVNKGTREVSETGYGANAEGDAFNDDGSGASNIGVDGNIIGTDIPGAPGMTAENMNELLAETGQSGEMGALGTGTNFDVLEKGPGYMAMSEEEKKAAFAKQAEAESFAKRMEESGVIGAYGVPAAQTVAQNPVTALQALTSPVQTAATAAGQNVAGRVGTFFKENVLPGAEKVLFGSKGFDSRNA